MDLKLGTTMYFNTTMNTMNKKVIDNLKQLEHVMAKEYQTFIVILL